MRTCIACGRECPLGETWGWKAHLANDDAPEVNLFCPDCVERELGQSK